MARNHLELRDNAGPVDEVFVVFLEAQEVARADGNAEEDEVAVRGDDPRQLGELEGRQACKGKLPLSVFLVINDNPYGLMLSLSFL
jgi:hypothetical protein